MKQVRIPAKHLSFVSFADNFLHTIFIKDVKAFEEDDLMDDLVLNTRWDTLYELGEYLDKKGFDLELMSPHSSHADIQIH